MLLYMLILTKWNRENIVWELKQGIRGDALKPEPAGHLPGWIIKFN